MGQTLLVPKQRLSCFAHSSRQRGKLRHWQLVHQVVLLFTLHLKLIKVINNYPGMQHSILITEVMSQQQSICFGTLETEVKVRAHMVMCFSERKTVSVQRYNNTNARMTVMTY